MWRWPFRGPNCVFCKCSSTTVWIHVERCTLTSTHEGTLWSVRIYHDILDDNNIEQCWRTSLFTVTTRHGSPPPSTLTQQRKRRACHSHPPRLAACHPWTALSAKHCPRLHKLAKRPPNEPLPCCAKTFVLTSPLRPSAKDQLPHVRSTRPPRKYPHHHHRSPVTYHHHTPRL
jgi:hypothetical protein